MTSQSSTRYHLSLITLHWIMALAIFFMLGSGLTLEYDLLTKAAAFKLIQIHKSVGVLLLVAIALRIAARLAFSAPPLPASFGTLESKGAHIGHAALYLLMIAVPLSGWTLISSSSSGLPTFVFGLFTWPHLPGIAGNEVIHDIAGELHETGAIAFLVVLAAHIGAVVLHAWRDKENLLTRMWITKGTPE